MADPGGAATLMVKTFDTDPPEKPEFSHALIVTVLLPASVVVPVRVAVAPVDFVKVRPAGNVPLETCHDFGWLGLPVTWKRPFKATPDVTGTVVEPADGAT